MTLGIERMMKMELLLMLGFVRMNDVHVVRWSSVEGVGEVLSMIVVGVLSLTCLECELTCVRELDVAWRHGERNPWTSLRSLHRQVKGFSPPSLYVYVRIRTYYDGWTRKMSHHQVSLTPNLPHLLIISCPSIHVHTTRLASITLTPND